jgi:neutral ceramidase
MLSATHDHSAPFASFSDSISERDHSFTLGAEKGMIESAHKAAESLQPAEVGYGTADVYLNTNRDAIDKKTRLWSQEPNPSYPSDKTLAVLEFRKPGGAPIALYMNYAMHATMTFLRGELSGDFPGAAERYVENAFDDRIVAMWTSGAAGDQNPLYLRQNSEI